MPKALCFFGAAIAALLGRVYADLQEDELLGRWLNDVPDGIEREPEYWHAIGIWLQRSSRHREAVRCFVETVTRDPTDRFAYLAMARSLTALDQAESAERATDVVVPHPVNDVAQRRLDIEYCWRVNCQRHDLNGHLAQPNETDSAIGSSQHQVSRIFRLRAPYLRRPVNPLQ